MTVVVAGGRFEVALGKKAWGVLFVTGFVSEVLMALEMGNCVVLLFCRYLQVF